jgi:peptidoglycan-associated lipoprotein
MKRIYCSFFLFLFLSLPALMSQPLDEIPYKFKLEAADTAFARLDYYNAADWYEQCYKDSRDPAIARRIAICHDKMRDYSRAERWYQRIVQKDTATEYPELKFEYGRLLKKNAKYEEAEVVFNELKTSGKAMAYKDQIENELVGIVLARTLKTPDDLLIENLGNRVNTRNSESSPAVDNEGNLYYVSFDQNDIVKVTNKNEDFHAKIMEARKDQKGAYAKGKAITDKINRPGFHNSHVSFSPDGSRMYYTRAVVKGGDVTLSDLYYSDEGGRGGWGAPQPITSLNGQFINKHPVVANLFGGEVLLFASNRPGTLGGLDLFYAPINRDGTFGMPVNLGAAVNTPGDEVTPQYAEGYVYFSSDGHPTLGGFDIFRSEWDGSKLLPAENMGKGINTSVDDLYYTPGSEDAGFLVSNRDGTRSIKSKTCCDDIFTFGKKEIIIKLLASVFEDQTPLPGATIKMYQKIAEDLGFPDVQKNEEGNEFTFALDADKAYKVIVERDGYFPDTADFNTVGVRESKNFRGTFRLKPRPEVTEPETEVLTIFEPIRLNNIYYDLDDDKILPDAEPDLDFVYDLMIKYPDMVIELSSHTDSRGKDNYNLDLSQRRANSAKQYLVQRGIDDKRIKPVGYGEKRIINRCTNGVNCSEEEHRRNRRTEFTIIEGPQTIEVRRDQRKQAVPLPENDNGSASLPGLPVLEFEKPELDLGSVTQGEKKKAAFKFKNTGDADLIIEVATACECTELDWPREPVKPGETGEITIEYDSKDKEGQQDVTVDVFANTEPLVTQASFSIFVEKLN